MIKKIFAVSILFILIFMSSQLAEVVYIDQYSVNDLHGTIVGASFGTSSFCVYGSNVCIVYKNNNKHSIELAYPKNQANHAQIKGLFEVDNNYIAIVADSYAGKSYLVSNIEQSPKYSRLYDCIFERAVIADDGIIVTGQKNGLIWIAKLSYQGALKWEQLGFNRGYFFQNCTYYNGLCYTVSRHHYLPQVLINAFSKEGKRMYDVEYNIRDWIVLGKKPKLDIAAIYASENGLFLAGRAITLNSAPVAFTLKFNLDAKMPDFNRQDDFINIISAYKKQSDYIMLAENYAHDKYILSTDNWERKAINIKGLFVENMLYHNNKLYIYGTKLDSKISSFFAEYK